MHDKAPATNTSLATTAAADTSSDTSGVDLVGLLVDGRGGEWVGG